MARLKPNGELSYFAGDPIGALLYTKIAKKQVPNAEHDYDLMRIVHSNVDYKDNYFDENGNPTFTSRAVSTTFDNNGSPYYVYKEDIPDGGMVISETGDNSLSGVSRSVLTRYDSDANIQHSDTSYNNLYKNDPGYKNLERLYNRGSVRRKQGGLLSYLDYIK